jgi:hypothetical protein
MNTATLLAIMLALVPPENHKHNGESEADARARYGVIAEAIADEADGDTRLALFLVVVARYESAFARKVHDGRIRGDDGKSWGLFQIMCGRRMGHAVPGTDYRAAQIVGVDKAATERAADAAAVHLRTHAKRCKGSPACVFKGYGGISKTAKGSDTDKRIASRVGTFRRLLNKHTKK